MKKTINVFLSYSHNDRDFARSLALRLRKKGYFVWLDEGEIKVGDSLVEKIRAGLDSVHFVIAIISKTSIRSVWVKEELELATNLRLNGRRIKVLPVLLHNVELPGFLLGKKYADFRSQKRRKGGLKSLFDSLPPTKPIPSISLPQVQRLKREYKSIKETVQLDEKFVEDQLKILKATRSEGLKTAIRKENRKYPQHAAINNAYAFEVQGIAVTLDYLLWIMKKAKERGSHPIEVLIALEGKWPVVKRMLQAYKDTL